jgi:lysine 2,3-aminomutase
MKSERMAALLAELATIESIGNVRVASRTPVTLPQRITAELCRALRAHPAVWLMTHFNHPRELTEESRRACALLVDHGIPVMNHTVLLRGINDDAQVLEQLFRGLVRARVRPYYLLQADPVRGTGHLRTPLAVGVRIMETLQGRLSGIALPRFIVDTPNGRGKVPVGADYVVKSGDGVTTLRTFRGELVDYVDPPV